MLRRAPTPPSLEHRTPACASRVLLARTTKSGVPSPPPCALPATPELHPARRRHTARLSSARHAWQEHTLQPVQHSARSALPVRHMHVHVGVFLHCMCMTFSLQHFAGYYSTAEGATTISTCQPCGTGTYSPQPGASSVATCVQCPAGTASPYNGANSSTTCAACPPGQFSSLPGQANCQSCPAGTATSLVVAA